MRLKKGFVVHKVGEEYMAVASGEAAKNFHGLIRNNESADYIYRLLLEETTEEEIVKAMCERYDASEEVIASDVKRIIEQLRKENFLDE